MTEDEPQDLLRTVAESHASLSEVALKLRRHRPPKAPALKTAIQAERGAFHLKRTLQQLVVEDLEHANDGKSLPELRRGGKAVDVGPLLRAKAPARGAMNGRDPQPRLSTRLMIMLVAEPPPRASQRPSNHSSSHGANSNIRTARARASRLLSSNGPVSSRRTPRQDRPVKDR